MLGFPHEVATPCPRRSKSSAIGDDTGNGTDSFNSVWEETLGNYDDTMNIDFTTETKVPILTGAKPRRKIKTNTSFVIHSDHVEKPVQAAVKQKRDIRPAVGTTTRKSSLLAQPAQRFRKVSFAPSPLKHSQQQADPAYKKRNTRPGIQKNNELLSRINGEGDEARSKDVLKKDIRRNTVYLPPENTTVASTFMGLFSPLKPSSIDCYTTDNMDSRSLESQLAKRRQVKRSLAPSPGRAPLQPSSKVAQEPYNRVDIPGKNGGKENIPPGMVLVDGKGKDTLSAKLNEPVCGRFGTSELTGDKSREILAANTVRKPLAARSVNQPVQRSGNNTLKATATNAHGRRALNIKTRDAARQSSALSSPLNKSVAGVSSFASRNHLRRINHEYPLISGTIRNPAMYDDNWLSHQEVVLTQLVNGLFDRANGSVPADDPTILRHEFLTLYQSSDFTTLYKRLQASLMYGTLSIPKDDLAKNNRLRHDLGMKRKFIDILLQTYNPKALIAALEAVTGRIFPIPKASSSIHTSAGDASLHMEKVMKKRLANFLDVFLVQNQDMDHNTCEPKAKDPEALGRAYRRTVLRSIMTVSLLDKARLHPKTFLSPYLFLASSPYKSSLAVLQALARFLLPSCGDISKALGQLNCQVCYQQDPLVEYEYRISNLAVDLRDGVRLTRIVELLLYPIVSCSREAAYDRTLFGTRMSLSLSGCSQWPLSQRLKIPTLSRAVKVFNVKTALDALASTAEGRQFINNIRAEDIVDGHREKTIVLLWGLVSKWGLSGLVNLDDLRKEIGQLKQRVIALGYELGNISDELDEHCEEDEPAALLKEWATLVAQLKRLHLASLASFADGKIYECILDEYEGYIVGSASKDSKTSLEDRLRALGCSSQFINILSPTKIHIPILDTHTTTSALAFLCSRLLPAAKCVRAAMTLQKAWRRVLDRRETQRRLVARDLARQCAAVVQTRDRILWAKGVIVHWWRMMRTKRRKRMKTKAKTVGRKPTKISLRHRKSLRSLPAS